MSIPKSDTNVNCDAVKVVDMNDPDIVQAINNSAFRGAEDILRWLEALPSLKDYHKCLYRDEDGSGNCNYCVAERRYGTAASIVEVSPEVGDIVEQNDGYCPCAIECTADTLCPCKEFREQKSGSCHCGRFRKEVI